MRFLTSAQTQARPSAHLLRVAMRPPPVFPHRRRYTPLKPHLTPDAPISRQPLLIARRSPLFTPRAHGSNVRYIHRHHHHHRHGGHCNCHGHQKVDVSGRGGGAAVVRMARAIGWADVADALREHVHACCISLGLLLIAAACPHVAPLRSVRHLPAALTAVAFPLVGVMATTTSSLPLCFEFF